MDISSQLRDFGLTEYESKVYVTLLGLKQAKVSDIARNCSVPRNKVYAVAESLHRKGFVEIIPEKVRKFRPVPFETATQLFIKEQESRLRSMEESARNISSFLSSFSIEKKESDTAGTFVMYKGRKMVYKKLREIVSGAKSKLFLIISWQDFNHISPIAKKMSKSADVDVLCNITEESAELAKKWASFSDVRHYEKTLPEGIAIADDSEALVFQTNSPVALHSRDLQFIALMKRFGSMVWDHSVSAADKIEEIETGMPHEEFKIIRGLEIYETGKKSSSSARKDIMRISTEEGLQLVIKHGVIGPEREAASGGVRVRYMFPVTKDNVMTARQLMEFAEVRHMDFIPIQVKIVDNNYCSIRQWEEPDTEPVTIVSTSHTFIEAMKSYFEKIWNDSMPAEKRIARLLLIEKVKKEAIKQGTTLSEMISPEKIKKE